MKSNFELDWFEGLLRSNLISFTGWTFDKKYQVKNAEQYKNEITKIVGTAAIGILVDVNYEVYIEGDTVRVTVSKI